MEIYINENRIRYYVDANLVALCFFYLQLLTKIIKYTIIWFQQY